MSNAKRLDEKDPGETLPLSWDFTDDIGVVGAFTITGTPTVTIAVDRSLRRNNDTGPTLAVNGAVQVAGKIVAQSVVGGVDGVDYKVTCKVAINSTPPSLLYKSSILPVRAQ